MSRTRQFIVWICMAASLWMGAAYPLHGLAHAVHALHEHEAAHDPDGAHDHGDGHDHAAHGHGDGHDHGAHCEQCGLFAALDGAAPSATTASLPALALGGAWSANAAPARTFSFTAYASRAPPDLT